MGYDERLRLLYVACTRACDHLVVSLHREERANPPAKRSSRTNAEVLARRHGRPARRRSPTSAATPTPLPVDPAAVPRRRPTSPRGRPSAPPLAAASRPGAVAATALTDEGAPTGHRSGPAAAAPPVQPSLFDDATDRVAERRWRRRRPRTARARRRPGLQKRPRDLDLPPWLKGRYGTAVGRAVHGVLQTIDLATGDGLDDAVAAQCQAEAVPDRADDVRRLVARRPRLARRCGPRPPRRTGARSTPARRSATGCSRATSTCSTAATDGLVVVDHKTSGTADPAELDRRVEGYRLQGAAYAVAVGRATGEPVVRVVFLFLTPQGAVERELADLDAAIAEVAGSSPPATSAPPTSDRRAAGRGCWSQPLVELDRVAVGVLDDRVSTRPDPAASP